MTNRIVEILKSNVTTETDDNGHPVLVILADDIQEIAADLSAAFEERMRIPHKCKRIVTAPAMGEGREWWIGGLTEKIDSYPEETHCLHMTTPAKSVVFLCNEADFRNLIIICRAVVGLPDESWMQTMMKIARDK